MDIRKTFLRNLRFHRILTSFKNKSANVMILFVWLLHLVNLTGILMFNADTVINGENNLQTEDLNNRIRDYTAKIFNITVVAKSERKLFLTNVFSSSFIFYTDESSSNILTHEDILQRHCIFKTPRKTNATGAQVGRNGNNKKQTTHQKWIEMSALDEDYFLEYDDSFTAKPAMNASANTSCFSCQHHEKAKKDSLESIKKHILMRLQLSQPPNVTMPPPVVPQKILDYFYKNFNYSKTMSPPSSVYKRSSNNKIHKRKTKSSQTHLGDELRDEEAADLIRSLVEENKDTDIMINENTSIDEHYSEEFYSRLHSIYVFPTKSRLHHSRKSEIFNFKYNSDPTRISTTILHVYIKGQNWIYDLMEKKNMEISIKKKQEIMIVIYRALRRPNKMNYTHTVKLMESRQKIPPGKGQWVEIEIKELSTYWMKTPNSTQSIVIRGMESWMRSFIVTEDQSTDKSLTMHIEIVTTVKNRYKRNAALDCRESDNEVRCCRYPLKVNFTNFGWNFIVAPQHFDAYFCNGECNVGYLEKYTHTHITSLSTSAKPCCSPQKLSPLALLYFDNNNKLMYSTIPNMSVEKCSCS